MVYKKSLWLLAAALILVSLFIYWPNSKMGYVLDDHYVIAQNPVVKHPTFVRIFGSGLFDHARRKTDSNLNYYRPFLSATFALDYQLWGMNPFAQRIVNLVIHILNTSLVFVFLYLLFRNFDRAGIGAIFFCILPIHEWSVRYLVGRGDLLLAFFTLSSLVSLIIFIRQEKKEWLWASLGLFVAALLSKEVALLNVAYIFMITFYATRQLRRTVVITAFFGIVAVGYYLLRLQTFPISASSVVDIGGLIQVAGLGVSYLLRFLMPWAAITAVPYGEMTALLWALSCLGLLIVGLRRSNVRNDGMAACVLGLFWIMAGHFSF